MSEAAPWGGAKPRHRRASPPPVPEGLLPDIGADVVLLAYRGSVAHGMWIPPSDPGSVDDVDLMGVVIPGPSCYCGLDQWGSRGTKEIRVERDGVLWDVVLYEYGKFARLLLQANPNVLSILWLRDEHYLMVKPEGRALIRDRDAFSSLHAYNSFVGYAAAQLERLTRGEHRGYMGEKRKALVDRFGYDPKNAAHLVRLLRMGAEFVLDGRMRVDRSDIDAEELLSIKLGRWPLEAVRSEADDAREEMRDSRDHSMLPDEPERERVNALVTEQIWRHVEHAMTEQRLARHL